ncbi:MAG: hypothetical protein WA705_06530 [Candidatus Ozemobacteraceae bacterium]
MTIHALVPCLQCQNVYPCSLHHCSYCGSENHALLGPFGRAWHWVKDAIGSPNVSPRNLSALAIDIENKITASSRQREQILKQFKNLCESLGLEKALTDIRTAFLKVGGGRLSEFMQGGSSKDGSGKDSSSKDSSGKGGSGKDSSGLSRFQTLTSTDFMMSNQDLNVQLSDLEDLLLLLEKLLRQPSGASAFYPPERYIGLLENALKIIRDIRENPSRLQQLDAVFKTIYQAREVLHRKAREYAMLRHAVRIEFWKAEGMKIRHALSVPSKLHTDYGAAIERLLSDGRRLAHVLQEDCSDQAAEDPLRLQEIIKNQMDSLEQWRLLSFSQQALGMVEAVKTLDGGYSDAQKGAETLAGLEQNPLPDPAVILHATFERFQEEEIRLAAEGRVFAGTQNLLNKNSE